MSELNGKRYTIGVLIDKIAPWGDLDYYQTIVTSEIEKFAAHHGMNCICYVTGKFGSPNDWERSRNILFDFIDSSMVDGLIVLSSAIGLYDHTRSVLSKLTAYRNIPIVTMGEVFEGFPAVTVDNYSGMRQAFDHLIEIHGCRQIAYIGGPEQNYEASVRRQAYVDALQDHGIPYREELVFHGDFLFDSGKVALRRLLQSKVPFDALAAANDNMIIGAMSEFYRVYGKLPAHLPIVGFDDAISSAYHSLTTVQQGFELQAQMAAEMLYCRIRKEPCSMLAVVPAQLMIRLSCGCFPSVVSGAKAGEGGSGRPLGDSLKRFHLRFLDLFRQAGISDSEIRELHLLDIKEDTVKSFVAEVLDNNPGPRSFLTCWKQILDFAVFRRMHLTLLQEVLSALRVELLPSMGDRQTLIRAENLLHGARAMFGEVIQRTGASLSYHSSVQDEGMEYMSESLMADLTLDRQMDVVHHYLPQYGIHHGFVALYEDADRPLEDSQLILGYQDGLRIEIGQDGLRFPTRELLPGAIKQELFKERQSLMVQALHQGDDQIGFVVFGIREKAVFKVYEIARSRLSVALKATLLLRRIRHQAENLERQVADRTCELSATNESLKWEVEKRRLIEEQLRQANDKLQQQNNEDMLTGLYNRRGFMGLLYTAVGEAIQREESFFLLFADLDNLKKINDQYGHAAGDRAIKAAADILRTTFPGVVSIARLGGDEFTVLIPHTHQALEQGIRERLDDLCITYKADHSEPFDISISIGYSRFNPMNPMTVDDLLQEADQRLYTEKRMRKALME